MLFVKFDEVREVLVREGWVALAVGEPIDHLTADARVEVQLALPRLGELLQGARVLLLQLGVVAAQSLDPVAHRSGVDGTLTCLLCDNRVSESLPRDQRLEPLQFRRLRVEVVIKRMRLRVEDGEGGGGGLGVGGNHGVGWLRVKKGL